MRAYKIGYLLIFFCCGCLLQALAQPPGNRATSTPTSPGKTYAVIIGISRYQNPAIPALNYADKDATLFASYLQSPAGGTAAPQQIKLLVNEAATIAAFYDALDWLKEQCGNNDLAYIYFAGHGDVETADTFSLGYLLAYNSPQNNYRNNAIRIEDLNDCANRLSITNQAKVVIITDACHTGKLAGDFYKGKQLVASHLRVILNNEVRMASCAADEEAAEGPNWGGGRGVFSYYLLNGMHGMADLSKDGTVQLQELTTYLDSSFTTDQYLRINKHQQRPVTDGNPNFNIASVDNSNSSPALLNESNSPPSPSNLPAGLRAFGKLGVQPIDYFFAVAENMPLEQLLDFDDYQNMPPANLPMQMVTDCILLQKKLFKERDSIGNDRELKKRYIFFHIDSLELLKKQLANNSSINNRFNEKLVQLVHQIGQDMVNAYLGGDIAELEKRQYYYAGTREYGKYLSMLQLALQVVPPHHHLAHLLQLHQRYLGGLIDRLTMVTTLQTSNLVKHALLQQHQALRLDPYAAYIHNELGNLYLYTKKYDSARYHFNFASELSPTWAIPWSNKIRMGLALNRLEEATTAIKKADSLQHNLAYVLTNAGLVMEKKKNWLAAEAYYLKSIKKNNVHFLPYERLGDIYISTGEYAKANTHLYEAMIRKKDFVINPGAFTYGVELGGLSYYLPPPEKVTCTPPLNAGNKKWTAYIELEKGLRALEDTNIASEKGMQLLTRAVALQPTILLAHHYLGKQLYRQKSWPQAEAMLIKSISVHAPGKEFNKQLINSLYGASVPGNDSCLLKLLLFYQYDVLEDHYLLARVFEEQKLTSKAIQQYEIIAGIENQRQIDQAKYVGFHYDFSRNREHSEENYWLMEALMEQYEAPIRMGGTISAAALYEQEGDYLQAEKKWLQQVDNSRTAGNARQAAMAANVPGTWKLLFGLKINFYWLNINSYLETATYNFYLRRMQQFPREGYWKEKAGLFLHNRLALAFEQMPIEEYESFYQSMHPYAYPWQGGEVPSEEHTIRFTLPGTGETVIIKSTVYDPLKDSRDNLLQSIRLSGELQANNQVLEALADVHSWMGNQEEALYLYFRLMKLAPGNTELNNKLIEYLVVKDELPAAAEQCEMLYRQNKATPTQLIQLANWQVLAGNNKDAGNVLKGFQPATNKEKSEVAMVNARMNWLSAQPGKALAILLKSPANVHPKTPGEGDDEADAAKEKQITQLYTIARLYAMQKQESTSLKALKKALDEGFNYKQVLDNDAVWKNSRNTLPWKTLLKNYELDNGDISLYPLPPIDPIQYRIPGYVSPYPQ